jgi:hypothetical protein
MRLGSVLSTIIHRGTDSEGRAVSRSRESFCSRKNVDDTLNASDTDFLIAAPRLREIVREPNRYDRIYF